MQLMSMLSTLSRFTHLQDHVGRLHGFQIKSVIISLVLGVVGLAGWGLSSLSPATNQTPDVQITQPASGSGFVNTTEAKAEFEKIKESWTEWFSKHGAKLGFGFAGGFAIGFAFRTFIKTMATLTTLAVIVFGALSYFKVLNVDMSSVQKAWESNSEWLMTQAGKLKDVAISHLPSSSTGFAGMFFGMKRKS